eukprot:13502058-Alexandrium_andersonii.AAC.1
MGSQVDVLQLEVGGRDDPLPVAVAAHEEPVVPCHLVVVEGHGDLGLRHVKRSRHPSGGRETKACESATLEAARPALPAARPG